MNLETRDTQTQVKHKILSDYLGAWSGIIITGLAKRAVDLRNKGRAFTARLLYVDGFAYKGRYAGDTSEVLISGPSQTPTWGSPVIGIQALDAARSLAQQRDFYAEVMSVLVEEHADEFADLQENLKLAGVWPRVVVNPPALTFQDGQIGAIRDDFLHSVDALVGMAQTRYAKSFFLLDPYGPKGIPYYAVRRVIALPSADVMINFPYQDLHRKLGILDRNLNEGVEKKGDRAVLANYDELFGTDQWREAFKKVWASTPPEERGGKVETELTRLYLERLRAADPALAVKHLRLQFQDRDRTMFYLYLTTHDPTGALALNEVLWKAKLSEYELRWNFMQAKWIHQKQRFGQTALFDLMALAAPHPQEESRNIDIKALARDIFAPFAGRSVTLKEVYTFLVDSDVFASEVDRALRTLKRDKLVDFKELTIAAVISFSGLKGERR